MDKYRQFSEKLDGYVKEFLDEIIYITRTGFEYDRAIVNSDKSGFPLFGIADDLYYKSKYQEGYLEWLVRDVLVNQSFEYLFKAYGYDIRWSVNGTCSTYGGYRNVENESKFPIEFFIVINEKAIAYCYTPFQADYSIEYNLPSNLNLIYGDTGVKKIDKWVSIVWESHDDEKNISKVNKVPLETEVFQKTIPVNKVFLQYFDEKIYEVFISKIQEAVKTANKLMGFQTIPRLVPNNISLFKEEVLEDLINKDFSKLHYRLVNKKGEIISDVEEAYIDAKSNDCIRENFENGSRYMALIGVGAFAQSFITSEYLFKIFREGIPFDYTSVIAGYLKSVEQLCSTIVYDIFVPKNDSRLFIKTKRLENNELKTLRDNGETKYINKVLYIRMKPENEQFYDMQMTMGQLMYFFDVNKQELLSADIQKAEPAIFKCMKNYFDYDRNGYFHKHNIDDYSIVKRIRENTFLMLYWLLGLTKLSEDESKNSKALGIVDTSFDRLYRNVAYRHNFRYMIKLGDSELKKVVRLRKFEKKYSYDEKGYIKNAQLVFVTVEDYPKDFLEYRVFVDSVTDCKNTFIIDQNNMPEEICIVDSKGIISTINY